MTNTRDVRDDQMCKKLKMYLIILHNSRVE
jgi:hypothetical protein